MNVGAKRKIFLRPAFMLAQSAKIEGKALTDIHAATVARMQTIDLQTISHILR